jgi:tetratricopeptide (TPR) repeat protein
MSSLASFRGAFAALCGLLIAIAVISGCAQRLPRAAVDGTVAADTDSEDDNDERDDGDEGRRPAPPVRQAAPEIPADLPSNDLTRGLLYEFLLAEIAGQRGNVGVAAQTYTDLARRTRDPRVARRATEIAIFARMNSTAIEAARIWRETDLKSPRALQVLATLLVTAGRLDEAEPHLKALLAGEGASTANAFAQLGRTLAAAQDKEAALRLVQKLAEGHAQLPQARFAVAQAAVGAGQDELALQELRRARELRPDWDAAVLLEAQVLQKRSAGEAIASLTRYLQKYPNSREVRLSYARLLVSEKRFSDARAEFQKLLADFPGNTEVVYAVALLSVQLNDYGPAETNLRRLLDMDYRDKDTVRLYLGQVAEEQNKYGEALKWYQGVESGEQFIPAQLRYAQLLAKQGKLVEGREHLRKLAAAGGPERVQLILAEAQLLRDANREKEAFQVVEQALDAQPEQPELLYDYAMLAERVDRVDVLESSLRKLIKIRPDHAHAYNALGYSLADRNLRLGEARELIEQALKLAPEDWFIVDSMGWVLYRQGNLPEAITWLRKAHAGRPDAEIAAHLGEVLWMNGDRGEAEKVWREAADKNPKSDSLLKTIKRFKP